MKPKKLIEVALPIKEISAESVRDKSIRHGHISTLHLWWARRPLPVCRAIVFASLVPDPLDDNCPQAFRDAIEALLNSKTGANSQYKPYDDIPYTSVLDPMEDNQRNRLMMFIGKFSKKCQDNMKAGKSTSPKEQLSDGSLIKWENKNNPKILRIARELIWVAYHSEANPSETFEDLDKRFNTAFDAITTAEHELYSIVDRNEETPEVKAKEQALQSAIDNFLQQMPSVFDPFAGGGAIPLEAARLGCRSYGNDINPVAHIIERGSAEFPQKYGKPIIYSKDEFDKLYGEEGQKMLTEKGINLDMDKHYTIPNRLAWDVEYYAKKILNLSKQEVGWLYPSDDNGNETVAYYWARTAKCSNPSCGAEVPMLKGFYLVNTPKKKFYLNPIIDGKNISFELKEGVCNITPFLKNRECSLTCPCCGSVTSGKDVKAQCKNHTIKERLLAVIREGRNGKTYHLPSQKDIEVSKFKPEHLEKPEGYLPKNDSQNLKIPLWGFETWASMFSDRQLNVLDNIIDKYKKVCAEWNDDKYYEVVETFLAIWIDRIVLVNTSFGRWDVSRESTQHPFSRQAIPMMFDFPESNPFCMSSGSAMNQLDWVLRYLESESSEPFAAYFANASSGEKTQFQPKSISACVTDPPYYDAIAYADLSDFFYVWMKQTLGELYRINFATPLTPKADECTAIKHHYEGDETKAKKHFESKLTQILDAIELQTTDIVSIMFAHQSTEAWTTLCNSIVDARMNIMGSWPMDTELANRSLGLAGAALESSVTVACRPSERHGYGDYKDVKRNIENKVTEEVNYLYDLGFRGADLLTACFGQAASEFGQYKTVEKADGSEVSVAELLDLAKNTAFDALLKGVQGDDYTKFYIGWLQLNGMGEVDFDDATKFTRVGVNVNISDIEHEQLLILKGNKVHLATAQEHIGLSSVEGTRTNDSPITQAHRAILLYKKQNRKEILHFIGEICPESSSPLWRLLATMKELLPPASDDYKQLAGLLQNAEDLRQHARTPKQQDLFA